MTVQNLLGVIDFSIKACPVTAAQLSHEIFRGYIFVIYISIVGLFWYNWVEFDGNIYKVVTAVKISWNASAVDDCVIVVNEDDINPGARFSFKMRGTVLDQLQRQFGR